MFVEFPKWLYRGNQDTPEGCIVQNQEEQDLFKEDGWLPVELFYVEHPQEEVPKKKGKK
jgi:hypothetical protein